MSYANICLLDGTMQNKVLNIYIFCDLKIEST
ncbi:MAG: hypothetical protein ACI84C_002740 [Flavobacteriales bacterium]